MTENELRQKVVSTAQGYLDCKEADGSHKKIIDLYNSHKPLARGYKVKYTDAWCSTFVSAVAIAAGVTDIIPTECGCENHIQLFKAKNAWIENDAYVPKPGDIIFYDWQDSANYVSTDDTGAADHIGIVVKVATGVITVIEGNMSDAVGYRQLKVNGRYIRGFGAPNYASKATSKSPNTPAAIETPAATVSEVKAKGVAKSFDKTLAGTYTVTALSGLNVRDGAGTSCKVLTTIPKGTSVKNYGYYTIVDGVKWLCVTFTYKKVNYTGFASKRFLSR